MKTLSTLLVLLTTLCLNAQPFGTFMDQPFLKSGSTANPYNPNTIAPVNFRWVASDISSNDPVATWTDRNNSFQLIQTNSWNRPTNSANGLVFDNRAWLMFSNAFTFPKPSSVVVIGKFALQGHPMCILEETNGNTDIRIGPNGEAVFRYGGSAFGTSAPLNPTNQFDIGWRTVASGGNVLVASYTNGVLVYSNSSPVGPLGDSAFCSVGSSGYQVGQILGAIDLTYNGYINEILVWTNLALTDANMAYMHNYAVAQYGGGTWNPYFNPASYGGLLNWVRSDTVSGGGNYGLYLTNGCRFGFVPDLMNPSSSASWWWGTGNANQGPVWYTTLGPNGKPAINNGENNNAAALKGIGFGVANVGGAQPNLSMWVIRQTNTTANQDILDTTYAGNRQQHMLLSGKGGFGWYAGSAVNNTATLDLTSWTILTVCYNQGNSFIRTNGVLYGQPASSPGTMSMNSLGMLDYQLGGYQFQGYMAEYLHWTNNTATNVIQDSEKYLGNKYGLTYYGQ